MTDLIEDYSDKRHKSWCIHCGTYIAETAVNEDHVPSRCLLEKPYPANLPKVIVCTKCNSGFSLDEEYVSALLGAVLAGSTDPEHQVLPRAARIFRRSPRLRARIEAAKRTSNDGRAPAQVEWTPEQDRVRTVVLKNARGHAYFELGEPMLDAPASALFVPLHAMSDAQRVEFETIDQAQVLPEVGSRMLARVFDDQDMQNGWVIVQEGVYRYAVMHGDGVCVRSVIHEYLATEVFWREC